MFRVLCVWHTARKLSGHPPACPRYPQVFEHPWCKSAADDKRELLKVRRAVLGVLRDDGIRAREFGGPGEGAGLSKMDGCPQLLKQLAFPLVCPSCSPQTMTRMKTSVRMMTAPPADAAGEPAMMESMKSGAVLDLEEQVGGSRGLGCWARQRRGLLQLALLALWRGVL